MQCQTLFILSKSKDGFFCPNILILLSLGEAIFASGKFKFKFFLNDLWYEPEMTFSDF